MPLEIWLCLILCQGPIALNRRQHAPSFGCGNPVKVWNENLGTLIYGILVDNYDVRLMWLKVFIGPEHTVKQVSALKLRGLHQARSPIQMQHIMSKSNSAASESKPRHLIAVDVGKA